MVSCEGSESSNVFALSQRRPLPKLQPHQDSSQLKTLLDPVRGFRDQLKRQGVTPEDHARKNAAAVKAASEKNKAWRQDRQTEERAQVETRRASARSTVSSSGYGTPRYTPRRPATASGDSRRSDAESVLSASQHKPRPFVTAVKSQCVRDKVSDWLCKDSYGQVPNYLVERQLEMAAQLAEEEAQRGAACIPEGMRVLPENERLQTLSVLAQSTVDTEAKLQALPFTLATQSKRQLKADLEARLQELMEYQALLQREGVLVSL